MKHFETTDEEVAKSVRQLAPNLYQIGDVRIHSASREIQFTGVVNMTAGSIEVVVCTESGKVHESVLVTKARPTDIHIAMLLLGLRNGTNPAWEIHGNPAYRPRIWDRPQGDRIDVFVSWGTPNGRREVCAGQLLMDQRTGKSLPTTDWVFVGSYLDEQGAFAAESVGSIVTNYHDQCTLIDCPLELARVDEFMFANERIIPKAGTPVRIRIVSIRDDKKGIENER